MKIPQISGVADTGNCDEKREEITAEMT